MAPGQLQWEQPVTQPAADPSDDLGTTGAEVAGDESPYLLHSPVDIAAVLRDLVRSR